VPRAILIVTLPLFVFLVVAGLTLGVDDDAPNSVAVVPTMFVQVESSQPLPTPRPAPTATAVAIRTDCAAIRGSDYRSAEERAWFQQNCNTTIQAPRPSVSSAQAGPALPPPAEAVSEGYISGSNDRLILSRLGINAPVNYRGVASDGVMGNPLGAYDVVWYDFSGIPGLGGYPGSGGNAVIAGHVDYRGVGPAVFYQLRNVVEGDLIEYRRSDGEVVQYVVEWISDIPPTENFAGIVTSAAGDVLTLVTCNGEFDTVAREYSHRRVVRAVRI
jgi:LPXTG-site transpeptidase (sortase) family protein